MVGAPSAPAARARPRGRPVGRHHPLRRRQEVYRAAGDLGELSDYMKGDDVRIHVSLAAGRSESTVWGCDLSDGYVRINADYTT